MKFKKITALVLSAAMVFSLAACGGNDNNKADDTAADTNTADQADSSQTDDSGNDGEKVTIKITWWGGQTRHDYTQELLDYYTTLNPHVEFEAVPAGWDGYFEKLSTDAAAGTMPDIVAMDYLYINTYSTNNSLADMQTYVDDGTLDLSTFDQDLVESGRIDGKLTGIVGSASILAFGYNPEVFEAAGVTAPGADWTWSDFVDICKQVKTETDKYGISLILADDTNMFNYYVRQSGNSLFSDDNKSLGYDDDQIFIDYVDMHTDLIEAGAMPNPDEYKAIVELGQEAAPTVTGDGAMIQEWHNYTSKMAEVNDTLQLLSPPYSETGTDALWMKPGYFWTIAETSKVKDEAAKFINWFLNDPEAADFIGTERGTPASGSVREYLTDSGSLSQKDIEMFEYVEDVAEMVGNTPDPDPVGISEVNEAFNSAVYSVLYGQATSEEAAATFRTTADGILERNN